MRRLLPPHFVVLALAVTVGLGLVVPVLGPVDVTVRVAGVVPLVSGAVLAMRGARTFEVLGTNIQTFDDPDLLVRTGLFARSRNPMYLGFLLVLVGAALLVGSLSAWLGPASFYAAASVWYIPFEERRMRARFGDEYEAYRLDVPRWIRLI